VGSDRYRDEVLGGHIYTISKCNTASEVENKYYVVSNGSGLWRAKDTGGNTTQFWMAREVGVSAHYEFRVGKGGSLIVIEEKSTICES